MQKLHSYYKPIPYMFSLLEKFLSFLFFFFLIHTSKTEPIHLGHRENISPILACTEAAAQVTPV